jgi:hypothetical protein
LVGALHGSPVALELMIRPVAMLVFSATGMWKYENRTGIIVESSFARIMYFLMMFLFVMKSRKDRRVQVSFRDLSECVMILRNSRNNSYPLAFQLANPVWGLCKCLFRISKSRDAGERYRSSSTVSGRVTRLLLRQCTSRRRSQSKTSSSWLTLLRRDSCSKWVTSVTSTAILLIIIMIIII